MSLDQVVAQDRSRALLIIASKFSAVLLAVYLFLLLVLPFQSVPPSTTGVVLKIVTGIVLFAGGFFLSSSRSAVREILVDTRPGLKSTLSVFLGFLLGTFISYCLVRGSFILPFKSAPFLVGTRPLQGIIAPMGAVWVLHSLGEELFFRGFLFGDFAKLFSRWVAVLLTSLCFSAAHLPQDWPEATRHLLLSLIITGIYSKNRNIYVAIAIHAGANTAGHYYSLYYQSGDWNRLGQLVGVISAMVLPFFISAVGNSMLFRAYSSKPNVQK